MLLNVDQTLIGDGKYGVWRKGGKRGGIHFVGLVLDDLNERLLHEIPSSADTF